MWIFDKLWGNSKANIQHRPPLGFRSVVCRMLIQADIAMYKSDYVRAVECYRNILKLESNPTVQYNLAILYAQGKGIEQNFMEAAYWFRQCELGGNAQAGMWCLKCTWEYIHQNFDEKAPVQLYADIVRFTQYVGADAENIDREACRKLNAAANNHFYKHEYAASAKIYRAAAEFGHDGYSQSYLAELYYKGTSVAKNDIAALYWFDKAVENGAADVAQKKRDDILNVYKTNLSPSDFYKIMMQLSAWCSVGSNDIPKDAAKALFWHKIGEQHARENAHNGLI